MIKRNNFISISVPAATVFISSACIMVLELVAGRLIARHLGSSLYTWTSVIGVVLAGITLGNYFGGKIADKFNAKNSIAVLLGISSIACLITIILNNIASSWTWLLYFNWPVRVFSHVTLVFFLPSAVLGTISPVIAKMALDRGLPAGRTIGDIYACGAAGSIAGTFLAGYYLISAIGTTTIIWIIAATLLIMAIFYRWRFWPLYIWATILLIAFFFSVSPFRWCQKTANTFSLRNAHDPLILYSDETQYCYVAVKRTAENPNSRIFQQDTLIHSEITLDDVLDLKYFYEQIHAAITHRFSKGKDKLSVLIMGGGGYVFPRYVEKLWPGSRVDVAEIDPGVTKAAFKAFGLEPNTTINTISADARNYVDGLIHARDSGRTIPCYDFIYEDALDNYSVPFQLTTKEFNDKLASILANDGIYMIELIDVYNSGLFLGAYAATLKQTFPYVYVLTNADQPRSDRNNFVIAAAQRPLDLSNLNADYHKKKLNLWLLSDSELEPLKQRANHITFTDDYAPVENLLAPVALQTSRELLTDIRKKNAARFQKEGKIDSAIKEFQKIISLDPSVSIEAYNNIALMRFSQRDYKAAAKNLYKAIEFNQQSTVKRNMAAVHSNLAAILQQLNQPSEALKEYNNAKREIEHALASEPNSPKLWNSLGDIYATMGDFATAADAFKKAVTFNPDNLTYYDNLANALRLAGKNDRMVTEIQEGIRYFNSRNQPEKASYLSRYIQSR